MFAAGLVSVSFREERPETILREAAAAGPASNGAGMSTSPPAISIPPVPWPA